MSLTIHSKCKYYYSTVQRAEDRGQKFQFCRLPFAVNVMLNLYHYKVFPSAVLKWQKVLRIRIIFCVTGQTIRYKKVLPRHWTGSRSQKAKDKAASFRKWYRNNFLVASVGSRARLNPAEPRTNLVLVSRGPLLYLEFNKPNKQNVSEINLF